MPRHPRLSCWLDLKDVTAGGYGYGYGAGNFHGIAFMAQYLIDLALLCMGFLQVIF